jgi:preprotein translocase subunit SecF
MVNESVNEVLIRSINTSLTSVLPVAGLLFVGVLLFEAVTLKDLSLAMFVGTLVSTYSSIFVAAPILAWLKEREPRYASIRERLKDSPRTPAPASVRAPVADEAAPEPAAAPSTPRQAVRRPAAPVRQRGRKRGRARRR